MTTEPTLFADLPPERRPREYRLVREADGLRVKVWFTVELASGWFEGHFPDNPVLPGVTQLHLAAVAGARAFGNVDAPGARVALAVLGSRRLKFKRPIAPGAALALELAADALPPARLRFTLSADGEPASSGTLIMDALSG